MPTLAALWSAAYDAEQACKWALAAELYQRGLDAFGSPRGLSQLDARLVAMRTEARDRCLDAARRAA